MQEIIEFIVQQLEQCSVSTKIFLLAIILAALLLFAYFIYLSYKIITSFSLTDFLKKLIKLADIIKKYELRTFAGFINILASISTFIFMVLAFASNSLISIFGINENNNVSKILGILLFVITSFISIWLMISFDRRIKFKE